MHRIFKIVILLILTIALFSLFYSWSEKSDTTKIVAVLDSRFEEIRCIEIYINNDWHKTWLDCNPKNGIYTFNNLPEIIKDIRIDFGDKSEITFYIKEISLINKNNNKTITNEELRVWNKDQIIFKSDGTSVTKGNDAKILGKIIYNSNTNFPKYIALVILILILFLYLKILKNLDYKKNVKIFFNELNKYNKNYIFILTLYSLAFVFVMNDDILHTGSSSMTLYTNSLKDFYDINNVKYNGNHYPFINYLLFGIWNFPIYFFDIKLSSIIFNIWQKLIIIPFYIGEILLINKIAKFLFDSKKSLLCSLFWATSPIVIFEHLIIGQTYSIVILSTLLGLYLLFKDKIFYACIAISFGVGFKYYPLLIFMPALLMIEKKPINLIFYGLITLIPNAITTLPFYKSENYINDVLKFSEIDRLFGSSVEFHKFLIFENPLSYSFKISFVIIFLIYIYSYLYKFTDKNKYIVDSLYISLFITIVLFLFTSWIPYRMVMITPFLCILLFLSDKLREYFYLEIIFVIAFMIVVTGLYQFYMYERSWEFGLLSNYTEKAWDVDLAFFYGEYISQNMISLSIAYILASLLTILLFLHPNINKNKGNLSYNVIALITKNRIYIGFALIILPLFISLIISYFINIGFDNRSHMISRLARAPSGPISSPNLIKGDVLSQYFKNDLIEIAIINGASIMAGNFQQNNKGFISVWIDCFDCVIPVEKVKLSIDLGSISPGSYFKLPIKPFLIEPNKLYSLNIRIDELTSGNGITLFTSEKNLQISDKLFINGSEQNFNLVYSIFNK